MVGGKAPSCFKEKLRGARGAKVAGMKYHNISIISSSWPPLKKDSLIRKKSYGSRDAVISDAVRALLVLKPGLKIEVALDFYKIERSACGELQRLLDYVWMIRKKRAKGKARR